MGADTWDVGRGCDVGMRAPAEADVLAACMLLLNLKHIPFVRVNGGAMRVGRRYVRFTSAPGCSDLVAALPRHAGRMLLVETKSARGRLTQAQAAFLANMAAAGALCLVVRDVKELQAELARLGY
jgi:hypothetical protein